jgi:3-phenylpropionate/trans-cinnamate dioxygenase ferredoxin component
MCPPQPAKLIDRARTTALEFSISMADFLETVPLDRLRAGKSLVVRVGGNDIALFNVDGNIYAISDACAHAGASLGSGKLRGTIVTCRAHGFRYDVMTGHCTNIAGLRVAAYSVKVVDGKIMIALPAQVSS